MKYLVFGSINIDLLFSVEHIVRPGETLSAFSLEKSAGGKGANQAAALGKAGLEVYFAGKAGADGEYILELLRSYNVNTDFTVRSDCGTGQAIIQVDKDGQNSILLYGGGNRLIREDEIKKTLCAFKKGDAIVLQNEINMNKEIIKAAKEQGLKIILNPSPCDEKIGGLPLDAVDIFFVNELEAAALAEGGSGGNFSLILDTLTRRFPKSEIILTAGRGGAFYGSGEKRAFAPIVESPVVDTTGAGDTFTGYFLAARERGFDVENSLKTAAKASSITISKKGAMQTVPFADEVFTGGIY